MKFQKNQQKNKTNEKKGKINNLQFMFARVTCRSSGRIHFTKGQKPLRRNLWFGGKMEIKLFEFLTSNFFRVEKSLEKLLMRRTRRIVKTDKPSNKN